jgi:hypothetical protein
MVLFYANKPGDPGIVLWEVALAALCFEVLYRSFGAAFRRLAATKGVALDPKRKRTFARDGNSYAVSFVHATIVVVRGFQHLIQQYGAPLDAKFVQRPYGSTSEWAAGAAAIEPTNTIFLAFLVYDVSHVLLEYPRLGSIDVVAHHVLFAAASYVCGSNRVFPWPFAWLIIGELSTLPLNLRWVLIQSGRGDTRLMTWTNRAFALTFFLGRVVVYGLGLLHLFRSWEPHVEEACLRVPGLRVVCALFVAGYGLNLVWFRRIVRVASRRGAADD